MSDNPQMKKTKEELSKIINDLQFHSAIVNLCFDSLDAIKELGNETLKQKNAKNFFYITCTSLIFRYEIELAKLVNPYEEMSVPRICVFCCNNIEHFNVPFEEIKDLCSGIRKEINRNKQLNDNLIARRNKALAHSDEEYYFYDIKYIEDYPINYEELKKEAESIYDFSCELQRMIGNLRGVFFYPNQADDVKHLFGLKTEADIEKENLEKTLKEKWNNG